MLGALPAWAAAVDAGRVGVEQVRLMARTFVSEAMRDALVEFAEPLLDDAITETYDRFAEYVSNLRSLVDTEGERQRAERADDRRNVSMRPMPDGSWRLWGRFGARQGAEINEILGVFNDAEFRVDWAAAAPPDLADDHRSDGAIDDDAVARRLSRMARREPQRRADALHAALLAACGAGERRTASTLNVVFDADTFTTTLLGGDHDPKRFREVMCRTQSGHRLGVRRSGVRGAARRRPPGAARLGGRGHRDGAPAPTLRRRGERRRTPDVADLRVARL